MKDIQNRRGFTLVEVLIALSLGTLTTLSAITLITFMLGSSSILYQRAELSKRAAAAVSILRRELLLAGYGQCRGIASEFFSLVPPQPDIAWAFSGTGVEAVAGEQGTELIVRYASGTGEAELIALSTATNTLQLATKGIISRGSVVLLADNYCRYSALLQISGDSGSVVAFRAPQPTIPCALQKSRDCHVDKGTLPAFATGSTLSPWRADRYYIARDDNGVPGLVRNQLYWSKNRLRQRRQLLVNGVESLRCEYALDRGEGAVAGHYQDCTVPLPAEHWYRVVSLRIKLSLRTLVPALWQTGSGDQSTGSDLEFTVFLRNQG